MISRKSIIQIIAAAFLLIGARLTIEFSSVAAYVYPESDFGQFWGLALAIFVASFAFVLVIAVRRLFQKHLFESLALLTFLGGSIFLDVPIDEHYWKFRIHKSAYQSVLQADSAPSPKYRVFNWGNRNTHMMGGGFIFEAIVYDGSDEIARSPPEWSREWLDRRSNSSREDLWIIQIPRSNPQCKRAIKRFDSHFYFVSEEC